MSKTQQRFHFLCHLTVLGGLVFILAACNGETAPASNQNQMVGGSEVGNPPVVGTRTVKGHISASEEESADCAKGEVQFADSKGSVTVSAVSDTCDFSSKLPTDATYQASLTGAVDDASTKLVFVNQEGETSAFYLGDGKDAVDLGDVVYDGTTYVATNDPATYSDADGDGLVDAEDRDDDNDGVLDVDEPDCDSDGISDDFDLDSACSTTAKSQGASEMMVKETLPNPDLNPTAVTSLPATEVSAVMPPTLTDLDNDEIVTNNDRTTAGNGNGNLGRTLHPVGDPDGDGRPGRTLHPVKNLDDPDGPNGRTLHPAKKNAGKKNQQKKAEQKETFWQWLNPFD
jgi:hypothetical protein